MHTKQDWINDLALEIAKARFGPGVDMGGKHNPRPSEIKTAERFVNDFEEWVLRNGRCKGVCEWNDDPHYHIGDISGT